MWGRRTACARLLVGFLDERRDTFDGSDMVVASPAYLDSADHSREYDHTRAVSFEADAQPGGSLAIGRSVEPPAIVRTRATARIVGHTWQERRAIAESELRTALVVPDPDRTRGEHLLVYEDMFTDGFTLRERADPPPRALRRRGFDMRRDSHAGAVPNVRSPYAHSYTHGSVLHSPERGIRPLAGVRDGPCRIRTCDLGIKSPLLYQLS